MSNKVNGAVVGSYLVKLLPVILAVAVTRGCMTQEQAEQAQTILPDLITWISGGGLVLSLARGWIRSLKVWGDKKG